MVDFDFIEKLREIKKEIEQSKGTVSLFAILKIDELTDKWTVILSASWVKPSEFKDTFLYLRGLLLARLDQDQRHSIARMGIFEPNNHLVQMLLDKYQGDEYIDSDEAVNGNLIHEGYILVASKEKQRSSSIKSKT
jgi:disulfide oxidoreductase YuzD